MSIRDHWHPLILSRDLRKKPVPVTLDGEPLVLFRTSGGTVGALSDVCAHRRMRLSLGRVIGTRLQCPYHGWTYGCDGSGESPGSPKLHAHVAVYETRDSHGLIWVKAHGSEAAFPDFDGRERGDVPMALLRHDIEAPLEVVLDNFTEMEHTPTTHGMFGYPLERMHEVEVEVKPHEKFIWLRHRGPCKTYPWLYRAFLGIGRHPDFMAEGVVRFSPVHCVPEYTWTDPGTGTAGRLSTRNVHFLVPLSMQVTRVFTINYMRFSRPGWNWILRLARPFVGKTINTEVKRDKRLLEKLADKNPAMEGMKLGRFDGMLGLCRQRLRRVYRGEN
jgi:phenylpropionate dioxygenase-like ring-hydroxylating dioxygenase large terminal subunit